MWHILIWHWSETVFGAGIIGLRNAGFFVFGIFDESKERMRSLDWRQDKDYIDYIDSGESAAVYIVKNIVKSLDTKNMWVDVVSMNTYYRRGSGNIAFNWIVVELFPRKIKPKYDTDSDYNRYLTWLTAHEDIEKQRDSGFHGEKFLVLCDLYDKNKNKYTTHTVIAKKYWEPMEAYRPMEIKNPIDPEWEYRVRAVKKVNAKQIRYIVENEFELEEKIRKNRRPTLRILGIEDGSPRSTKRH